MRRVSQTSVMAIMNRIIYKYIIPPFALSCCSDPRGGPPIIVLFFWFNEGHAATRAKTPLLRGGAPTVAWVNMYCVLRTAY